MTGYKASRTAPKVKFMQTINKSLFRYLNKQAKMRGIILQEFLRAIVIPEWLADQKAHKLKARKTQYPRHASR